MGNIDPRIEAGDDAIIIVRIRTREVYDDGEGDPEVLTDTQGNEYHRDDIEFAFLAQE